MASNQKYAQVGRGTRGQSAAELKELLRRNGYGGFNNTSKFGYRAAGALKQFQKDQGMAGTGVADDETWAALMKKFEGVSAQGNPYNSYLGGSANQADLTAVEGARPGPYESGYQDQIDGLLSAILDRQSFSYDMNADPLYQQYKDQYTALGRSAMEDVMGQASALTGGYGNSYAATAGSQAYQGYLRNLNDKALDLYDRAYGAYQDQGESLMGNLSALKGLDDSAYGRHRDQAADWQADRAYNYDKVQDDQDQANWQKEYDYATRKWKKKK